MITGYLTDVRDCVVFGETPTLMQPLFGEKLPEPEAYKHRFVVGQDGLYIEAQNSVVAVRQRIAESGLRLPYGKIEHTGIQLRNGKIPGRILGDVLKKAAAAVPNEWAGMVVWNGKLSEYQLFEPDVVVATPGRVSYLSSLPDGLILVMDLHSHGNGEAFFSTTDNESDLGGFYVAAVLGHCESPKPSTITRMVVNGQFLPCPDLAMFFDDQG
jgi:PRTRC genetic system protein A